MSGLRCLPATTHASCTQCFSMPRAARGGWVFGILNSETGRTQLSGTQFDKITTTYEYWKVVSPSSAYFNEEFSVHICVLFLLSLSCRTGSADNWIYQIPINTKQLFTSCRPRCHMLKNFPVLKMLTTLQPSSLHRPWSSWTTMLANLCARLCKPALCDAWEGTCAMPSMKLGDT